jgi:hypothetical protein
VGGLTALLPAGGIVAGPDVVGRKEILPVVFVASLTAAIVNHHRPIVSWCGLPGAILLEASPRACRDELRMLPGEKEAMEMMRVFSGVFDFVWNGEESDSRGENR